MTPFADSMFNEITRCPWCNSESREDWGEPQDGIQAVECSKCGLIYMGKMLNAEGLAKFYSDHLSQVHLADENKRQQRELMYQLEFKYIHGFTGPCSVLDVGCSGGYFLDVFKEQGYETLGVEIGTEGAAECGKKHSVYQGDFAFMDFDRKFDLIVFRGVIEHIPLPKTYLEKALSLLNDGGYIYITSTPNAQSVPCRVFKDKWRLHNPLPHLMHFSVRHFDEYFASHGFCKRGEHFLYEETPYANIEEDILLVAKAIEAVREGKKIDFASPPFYGVMMSVVYQKEGEQ
ncbi:class I SAM-dependent methyltransferase [Pseudodesulfovibrio cashew]|nr:class I SAM-dependent methyltransferase [Pseudodesulfovibrio cashew]